MSVCVCAGKPPRRHTPPLHDLIFHHKSVSQRDVLLCSLLWSNNLWAEHGEGRAGALPWCHAQTHRHQSHCLLKVKERGSVCVCVCLCVFVYKSLHANTKWTRAQLGLRCGPQQRKHDSDSHIQSFTHTSTRTPTHALTARPAPTRDGLAALLPWQTSDGWRAEKMKGRKGWWRRKRRWEGWGEGACMHARVVLEERKRAECSGLGAREDLTRGPSRSFPPRQHVSFPLNKQPFCGHERGWRSALSISPLSPLPLPPSVLLYLLYEPLCVCVCVSRRRVHYLCVLVLWMKEQEQCLCYVENCCEHLEGKKAAVLSVNGC